MGYIRDNDDYYRSIGRDPEQARLEDAIDEANIDYGYCNPNKAKFAAETEEEIKKAFERDNE